ncbi:MAG: hypothetical protein IKC79_01645 [Clostridia bacterium]|nr:hypothetical protein [Clostridia bacterium]
MKMDCDFQSVKLMLDANPVLSHYYQKKVLPFVSEIERQLSSQKSINYPKLNIREFANNFDAICTAYDLNIKHNKYYYSIMKQMNMAIYFSEKNRLMWFNHDVGVNPPIYDMALSIISTKKLNSVIDAISREIQYSPPFSNYQAVENIQDLQEYAELIESVKKDSTKASTVSSGSGAKPDPYFSEFGNY